MTTKTRYYNSTGRDFLAKAQRYLAEDDLLQASEKGWGAAAQMVKCVADARGWSHEGHRQLWSAVNRLVEETGDQEMQTAFGLAGALHTNFYEGWLPREIVQNYRTQVEELVSKLEALSSYPAAVRTPEHVRWDRRVPGARPNLYRSNAE